MSVANPITDVGGVAGALQKKWPLEMVFAMLLIQQATQSEQICKSDQVQLQDSVDQLDKVGRLTTLLNKVGTDVGMESSNTVEGHATQSQIDEINSLIKDLGFTDLFGNVPTTYDGAMYNALDMYIGTTSSSAETDFLKQMVAQANKYSEEIINDPTKKIDWPSRDPSLLTTAQRQVLANYMAKDDGGMVQLTNTGVLANMGERQKLADLYTAQKKDMGSPETVGLLTTARSGREVKSAIERLQNKQNVVGKQMEVASGGASERVGNLDAFLAAARKQIEEWGRNANEIMRKFG